MSGLERDVGEIPTSDEIRLLPGYGLVMLGTCAVCLKCRHAVIFSAAETLTCLMLKGDFESGTNETFRWTTPTPRRVSAEFLK